MLIVSETRVQFSSATFSGLESSSEVLINIEISGAISTTNISINIELYGITATGKTLFITSIAS